MSSLGTFLRGGTTRPNAAPALRITLARRLVETPGAPFVPSEEVFTDVASARDELGLLPAAQGPTVVRVRVEGGTAADREALAGDWLVDPDAGGRVSRLPIPQWTYDPEAKAWAGTRPWLEAWETCADARWMLRAAGYAGIARPLLALAACACARTALPLLPAGEERPLRAIEATERWTRGEATLEEVRATRAAARDASADTQSANTTATFTYPAAHYCAEAAADATAVALYSSDGANAATYAAYAQTSARSDSESFNALVASLETHETVFARCADLVRSVIHTLVVLRAVATLA